MIKLKDLLMEDPDVIAVHNDSDPSGNMDKFRFDGDAVAYTLLIYDDLVDGERFLIAYGRDKQTFFCENSDVIDEIYNVGENKKIIDERPNVDSQSLLPFFVYHENNIKLRLEVLSNYATHANIILTLYMLKRCENQRGKIFCDGRIFFVNGKYYFTFWPEKSKIVPHKTKLDDFMKVVGIDKKDVLFELDNDGNWIGYDKYFNTPSAELSSAEKVKRDIQKQLHVNKGILDKAILQVLQSRPKDTETLYARLERQMGMPIVKIRHLFGNIPLDKLVAKQLKEFITQHKKVKHD